MAKRADGTLIIEGDFEVEGETKVEETKVETGTEKEIEVATEGEEKPEGETEDEADEVDVTIGGDAPPSEDDKGPEWVNELRKERRELIRKNRELEDKLANQVKPEKQLELGAKPTLESCEYDEAKLDAELDAWHDRKRKIAEIEAETNRTKTELETEYKAQQTNYAVAKGTLSKQVKDFDEAESVISDTLSVMQQGIIVRGAKNSALVVYALGKSPTKAKELASIKDPIKFAFAVAKLETELKVTKKAPAPERRVKTGVGTGAALSKGSDQALERLRAEAAVSGNFSKVHAYKQQLKAKGK